MGLILAGIAGLAAFAGVLLWGFLERRAARRERERSLDAARRADAMLRAAPGGYIAWDETGCFIASPRIREWLGLDAPVASLGDLCPLSGDRGFDAGDVAALSHAVADKEGQGARFPMTIHDAARTRRFEVTEPPGPRPGGGLADVLWIREITIVAAEGEAAARARDDALAVLEAAPMPIWRRSGDLAIAWANRAYVAAVEASGLDAVIGEGRELSPPSLADSPRRMAAKALAEGKPVASEHNIVVEGALRVFDITDAPFAGDPDSGAGVAGFAIDRTDLHESRAALERHSRAHAQTLDALTTAVAIFGPDKTLSFHNAAFRKMWRLDGDWLAGAPRHDQVIEMMREARRLPEQTDFQAWKRAQLDLYTRVIEPLEELWHLPDGAMLRVVCQPHPLGGLLFLFEDVTDRFALERSYNTLIAVQQESLDKLFEGVTVFGGDGRLRLFNPAFARIFGLTPAFLSRNPHISDIIEAKHDLLAGAEWETIRRQILGGAEDRRAAMKRLARPDGSFIDYACVPLPDGATLHTYLDVTDSVRIEQALREHNEALAAANRLKTEFVANVSYQLRTPLNTIMGFSEILEGELFGALNAKQHGYTSGILESAEQLRKLIDEILDLAMIEAGVLEIKSAPLNLYEILEGVWSMAREQARPKDIRVTLDCAANIGEIEADEKRIKQALFSLISNAIQYTPEGGDILLAARRDGEAVTLTVADNGVGMPPEEREAAFEPFHKGAPGGYSRGLGLGLTLARRFFELHGGRVTLDPAQESGTRVDCVLPCDRA